jgi:endogenous inhibitor of DNA gyrase (YacG/DUF329 family)
MKCPICKKAVTWENNPYRPFCSERCSLIDLAKWADGDYNLPVEESDPEESIDEERDAESE